MIVLYGPSMAPFTEKCRRALLLKGLEFDLREPEGPEDFKRWSPKTGLLPVLTIDEELVSDSTEILLRLDQLWPDPPLLSPEPQIAEQQRSLEDWADESFLWYWNRWARVRPHHDAGNDGQSAPRAFRRLRAWLAAGGTWERPLTGILRGVNDRMVDLENFLGARPYFYAERISMADLAVYSMLRTMEFDAIPGSAALLIQHPPLVEFLRRVEDETAEAR
jgi:glutathione S-transferase